jgi:curved DNA-binding protein CbpA
MSIIDEAASYYQVMEIHRDATHEDIVKQYRALAQRCNPLKNPTNMSVN